MPSKCFNGGILDHKSALYGSPYTGTSAANYRPMLQAAKYHWKSISTKTCPDKGKQWPLKLDPDAVVSVKPRTRRPGHAPCVWVRQHLMLKITDAHTDAHIRTHARTRTHTHALTYTHAHKHTHTSTHAHENARTHARTHTHKHSRTRIQKHTHTNVNSHVHIRTHTQAHTYAHTRTHMNVTF